MIFAWLKKNTQMKLTAWANFSHFRMLRGMLARFVKLIMSVYNSTWLWNLTIMFDMRVHRMWRMNSPYMRGVGYRIEAAKWSISVNSVLVYTFFQLTMDALTEVSGKRATAEEQIHSLVPVASVLQVRCVAVRYGTKNCSPGHKQTRRCINSQQCIDTVSPFHGLRQLLVTLEKN